MLLPLVDPRRWLLVPFWLGLLVPLSHAVGPSTEEIPVLVRGTVTDLGSRQAEPDPELNPIHYRLITHGYVPFGASVPGDRAPDRDRLLAAVVAALKPHGLLPADAAHPPRLVLGVVWGSIMGAPFTKLEFLRTPVVRMKWRPFPGFQAPYDAAWDRLPTKQADHIRSVLRNDLVVLSLTAYDYDNAARGAEIPFWQLRIMASLQGRYADDLLPGMIETVAAHLGTDESLPLFTKVPVCAWADLGAAELSAAEQANLVVHDHGATRFD